MATRSLIAHQLPDGVVSIIYCHWGGYLEYNGVVLRRYYSDPAKLEALIALGGLSELGTQIGEKHEWRSHSDDPIRSNWCLAYHRDRGEALEIARIPSEQVMDYAATSDAEFLYLFRDGGWWVAERTGWEWGVLVPIADALEAERRRAAGVEEDYW